MIETNLSEALGKRAHQGFIKRAFLSISSFTVDKFSLLFSLIFPSFCVHCDSPSREKLCETCLSLVEFSLTVEVSSSSQIQICFEEVGPILSLSKKADSPSVYRTLAAFMVMRLSQMEWKEPEKIIPFPGSFSLAKECSCFLKVPCQSVLKKRWETLTSSKVDRKRSIGKVKGRHCLVIAEKCTKKEIEETKAVLFSLGVKRVDFLCLLG